MRYHSLYLNPEVSAAAETLEELATRVLGNEDDLAVAVAEHFEAPSLHDLFDVPFPDEEEANAAAVEEFFPVALLREAEAAEHDCVELDEVHGVLETPPPPVLSPAPLELAPCRTAAVAAPGSQVELDLECHEEMFSDSESDSDSGGARERVWWSALEDTDTASEGELRVDCPERPGERCLTCNFHRAMSGDPQVYCALCYMRLTSYQVFSECGANFMRFRERSCPFFIRKRLVFTIIDIY